MQKNSVAKIALYLVVILVFNVLYYNMIENHTPARWVSYVGIHLSYLLLCVSSLSYSRFDSSGSVVHVYPKMMVAYGYFMASLICGSILILINNSTITFPVIVHALIIGFYISHYLLLMNAEAHTECLEAGRNRNMQFLKECETRLKHAMDLAETRDAWRCLERLRVAIAGASMDTCQHVTAIENRIVELLKRISHENSESLTQTVDEAVSLFKEREMEISINRHQ